MATLSLVRIDHRLIHGQVMTMWSREYHFDHILVIDDPLSKDPFMKKIYRMAVPGSLEFEMISVDDAAQRWKENKLGLGNYLILIRDVETALRVWKAGFDIEKLQIGNVEADASSEIVHKSSRLSTMHIPALVEMFEGGVEIYLQAVPGHKPVGLSDVIKTQNR